MTSATRLSFVQTFAYGLAMLGSALPSIVISSWIFYFYCPPEGEGAALIATGLMGVIRIGERVLGAVLEPMIGHLSDRTNTRWGRRRPWIAGGAPLMVLAFVAIWFPPHGLPTNDPRVVLHFAVFIVLFWTAYTANVSPYLALLPELATDEPGRVRLSVWLAAFEVVANVVGGLASGWLIELGARRVWGVSLDDGYQVLGVVIGLAGLAAFAPMLALVREPPRTAAHEVHLSLPQAARASLGNPLFLPYAGAVGGYKMATAVAVIGVPFIATQLMGVSKEAAGAILAVIIVAAALFFPLVQAWAGKFGAARVFGLGGIGFVVVLPAMGLIGLTDVVPPLAQGVTLFALAGFSVACVMVLPRALLAEVIDHDVSVTGLRREAMYNGMSGVVEKGGEAGAWALASVLFELLGNSASSPLGLRLLGVGAAGGVALGLWSLSRYQGRRMTFGGER